MSEAMHGSAGATAADDVSTGDNPALRGANAQLHDNSPAPQQDPVRDNSGPRSGNVLPADSTPEFASIFARLQDECQALIAQYEDSRSALLPIMHLFQDEEGFVSASAMQTAANMLNLPLAIVESTVSFYTLLFRRPVGKYMLQVCRNLSCSINGADVIMEHMRERLGLSHLETSDDGIFSYEEVECLAACDRAPCMQVNLDFVFDLTPQLIDVMLEEMRAGRYRTPPMAQTKMPDRHWHVPQDTGKKSAGALGVSSPNAPGGIGDQSGADALDRILKEVPAVGLRTHERLVRDRQTENS